MSRDATLDALEQESIYAIREAYAALKPLALLWSMGKDSNTLLWLVRKAFLGRVPFPVMLLDTGNEFDEVYAFRDRMIAEWDLDYMNVECPPVAASGRSRPRAGMRHSYSRDPIRRSCDRETRTPRRTRCRYRAA